MFVTNWISTTKIQKISEITNFFRHYFLSRTEVRIDLVLKTDKSIFIFELKYKKSADIAMAQISDKNYAKAFADDGRKVVKVGINFLENQRSIEDWVIE